MITLEISPDVLTGVVADVVICDIPDRFAGGISVLFFGGTPAFVNAALLAFPVSDLPDKLCIEVFCLLSEAVAIAVFSVVVEVFVPDFDGLDIEEVSRESIAMRFSVVVGDGDDL